MKYLNRIFIAAFIIAGFAAPLTADSTGQESTSLKKSVPASPEEGGPRNWQVASRLNLREQPSTQAKILTQYAVGTILDNLGCKSVGDVADDTIWCDVQKLGGGLRGFVAAEYITPAVSPNGSAMTGPDDSALRAGQGDFDATGQITCIPKIDQPSLWCDFGVARAGGGYATVAVTRPDGRSRAIFFSLNVPIGADTSEADPGEFSAERVNDMHVITIGGERYEIPDAVPLGG